MFDGSARSFTEITFYAMETNRFVSALYLPCHPLINNCSVGRSMAWLGMYVLGSSAHRSNNALGTIGPVAKKYLFPCAFAIPFTSPREGSEMRRACLRLCTTNLYVPETEKREKNAKTENTNKSPIALILLRRLEAPSGPKTRSNSFTFNCYRYN